MPAERGSSDPAGDGGPTPAGRPSQEWRELLGAERLVVFTDAVVAIALTLLVLPLLEAVPEQGSELSAGEWLSAHANQLLALLVSFLVVASSWTIHHRLWAHVQRIDARLLWLDFGWLATIVFLQLPTALVYALDEDRVLVALYAGTITLGSIVLTAMALQIHAHSACQDPEYPLPTHAVAANVAATAVFVVTFVVAVSLVRYDVLVLLVLIAPARQLGSRWGRRDRRGRRGRPTSS